MENEGVVREGDAEWGAAGFYVEGRAGPTVWGGDLTNPNECFGEWPRLATQPLTAPCCPAAAAAKKKMLDRRLGRMGVLWAVGLWGGVGCCGRKDLTS